MKKMLDLSVGISSWQSWFAGEPCAHAHFCYACSSSSAGAFGDAENSEEFEINLIVSSFYTLSRRSD